MKLQFEIKYGKYAVFAHHKFDIITSNYINRKIEMWLRVIAYAENELTKYRASSVAYTKRTINKE